MWWEFRELVRRARPEQKAIICLRYGRYKGAIYWLHKMLEEAGDLAYRTRPEIVALLEPHLKALMKEERVQMGRWGHQEGIYIAINRGGIGHVVIDKLEFPDNSFEAISTGALREIGGLELAQKVFELRGKVIPDQDLLEYAKLCMDELRPEEALKACRLVRERTPKAAFLECGGTISSIMSQVR